MDKPRNTVITGLSPRALKFELHDMVRKEVDGGEEIYLLDHYILLTDDEGEFHNCWGNVAIRPVFEKDYEQFRKDYQDKIKGDVFNITDKCGDDVSLMIYRIEGNEEYDPRQPGKWCLWHNNKEIARVQSELCEARANSENPFDENTKDEYVLKYRGVLREFGRWYGDNKFDLPTGIELSFVHSVGYTVAKKRDTPYQLTGPQSATIKLLHEHFLIGTPELRQDTILELIDSKSKRLKDVFHNNSEARNDLIASGKRRGTYRLNI